MGRSGQPTANASPSTLASPPAASSAATYPGMGTRLSGAARNRVPIRTPAAPAPSTARGRAVVLHRWPRGIRWFGMPYLAVYQLLMYWELGIELNYKAEVGPRLRLYPG